MDRRIRLHHGAADTRFTELHTVLRQGPRQDAIGILSIPIRFEKYLHRLGCIQTRGSRVCCATRGREAWRVRRCNARRHETQRHALAVRIAKIPTRSPGWFRYQSRTIFAMLDLFTFNLLLYRWFGYIEGPFEKLTSTLVSSHCLGETCHLLVCRKCASMDVIFADICTPEAFVFPRSINGILD